MSKLFSMIIFLLLPLFLNLYSANKVTIIKSINLRDGPSVGSAVLTYAIPKDVYIICDEKVGWYEVTIKAESSHVNEVGWIHSSLLKVGEGGEAVVLGKGCTLRKTPMVSADNRLSYIKSGAIVSIMSHTTLWLEVERKFNSMRDTVWLCNLKDYVKLE